MAKFGFQLTNDRYWSLRAFQPESGWDVETATNQQNSILTSITSSPDMHFSADGTKFFAIDDNVNRIVSWDLTTAWDIGTRTNQQQFNINSTHEPEPEGIYFRPDGLEFYIIGSTNAIRTYTMSTAWDITTATGGTVSSSYSSQTMTANAVFFRPDGAKLYIGSGLDERIDEYRLITPWNITTMQHLNTVGSLTLNEFSGFYFKPNGMKLYIIQPTGTSPVKAYAFTRAWDITSLSSTNEQEDFINVSISGSVFFKPDGSKVFLLDSRNPNSIVWSHDLTIPAEQAVKYRFE